jgi:hypothetical protein
MFDVSGGADYLDIYLRLKCEGLDIHLVTSSAAVRTTVTQSLTPGGTALVRLCAGERASLRNRKRGAGGRRADGHVPVCARGARQLGTPPHMRDAVT